ncbi:MAG: Flp family type IVb pilin [Chloroflexota bacterium]|nr:Flp family type IVb pilin [Chloroflexota bacterium]
MNTHIAKTEHGQGAVEYALIAALIAVTVALSLSATGTSVKDMFCIVASGLGAEELCGNTVAFSEDFSDISDCEVAWGRWSIKDGKLHGSRWGGIFNKDFSGEDYTLTVGSANLSQGNGYGIFFRAQDYDRPEGYIFQYDPGWGGGAFLFRKWVDGHEIHPFAVQRDSDFDWHGEDHEIQVKVEGDTYTAYVDGEEVLNASDSTYQEGGVGFRVWDRTEVDFDDLSITTP